MTLVIPMHVLWRLGAQHAFGPHVPVSAPSLRWLWKFAADGGSEQLCGTTLNIQMCTVRLHDHISCIYLAVLVLD